LWWTGKFTEFAMKQSSFASWCSAIARSAFSGSAIVTTGASVTSVKRPPLPSWSIVPVAVSSYEVTTMRSRAHSAR
jgi:hypothetical protein